MADQFLFCADNLFADTQYSQQLATGDEEPSGYEAWRVGVGRRYIGNRWQASTANADHTLSLSCKTTIAGAAQAVPRGANFLAIDRASNHLGHRFQLLGSDDAFATSRVVFDITLPTVPGGQASGALGCVTDEGAWFKTFPADVHNDWRLVSKAMGAGAVPQLTGVYLGMSWQPTTYPLVYPLEGEALDIQMTEDKAPSGWTGRSRPALPRKGVAHFKPGDQNDYDHFRYQALGLYAHGQPAWICEQSADRPWRAMLVRCPSGLLGWPRALDWPFHTMDMPYEEEAAVY